MIKGYIRGKTRKAEDKEIKTIIYNILRNTEAIGQQTMEYQLLTQRVAERLDEIRLTSTHERIEEIINDMTMEDMLYRVSNGNGFNIGLVI